MKGWWREGTGWGSPRLRLGLALAVVVLGGCGGGEQEAVDGEELEPRIVTEGPVDAPGRPEGRGEVAAVAMTDGGGRWVPHLTVGDLAVSMEFYRALGFVAAAGGEAAEGRVELERDGVRLVLVAARGEAAEAVEAGEDGAAEEGAAAAPAVLHLVDEAGGAARQVRDPDGHLLVISGG